MTLVVCAFVAAIFFALQLRAADQRLGDLDRTKLNEGLLGNQANQSADLQSRPSLSSTESISLSNLSPETPSEPSSPSDRIPSAQVKLRRLIKFSSVLALLELRSYCFGVLHHRSRRCHRQFYRHSKRHSSAAVLRTRRGADYDLTRHRHGSRWLFLYGQYATRAHGRVAAADTNNTNSDRRQQFNDGRRLRSPHRQHHDQDLNCRL